MFDWILNMPLLPVKNKETNYLIWKTQNFMAPFYGWDSTVSRLLSHYEETVHFLPLTTLEFLLLI